MKVGDYVRTDTGQIGKITLFEGDLVRVDTDKFINKDSMDDCYLGFIDTKTIFKVKKND